MRNKGKVHWRGLQNSLTDKEQRESTLERTAKQFNGQGTKGKYIGEDCKTV